MTPDGATVELAGWSRPAVEVEVAHPGRRPTAAVAGLAPALELVDLDISFDDIEPVLAANICQRGVVFGDEVPGVDPWSSVAVAVTKDGEPAWPRAASRGPRRHRCVRRSFLAAHGASLEPGQRIIAGSVVAPVAVAPGDELASIVRAARRRSRSRFA